MRIVHNKAIEVAVRKPERITRAIEKSKLLKRGPVSKVLVHWSLENCRRMANLGLYRVITPIMRDYNWPGKYTPFEHQKETANFLVANNRSYCFSEQGTGKTASVIWASDYLMTVGDIKRVLIISPLSTMQSAWGQDIFNLTTHRNYAVAHGTRDKRIRVIENEEYEFVIINFDGAKLVADELKDRFDLIVIDEANYVKNSQTKRWKAINRIIRPHTKLWMLTGTPSAQSPVDAFGLAKMNTPTRVPKYFGAWRDRVMVRLSQFKYVPAPEAKTLVNAALQPAIRFKKADCLDLPPVTYQTREIELTAQQKRYYKELRKQMMIEAAGHQVTAVHAAAGLNKLLQLSCGAVYSDDGSVLRFDGSNRINEVEHVIEESSSKVIVFAPFRHAITHLVNYIQSCGYGCDAIHGGVSSKKRTELIRRFQDEEDELRVLVIQPQSASHGVTLTAADTIIWFGPTSSVETWLQANERINRPGQTRKMTIIKIVGSDVEKQVYRALESREMDHHALTALYDNVLHAKNI